MGRLTVDLVAERAGVGKPTIYRYWKNAQELAMAAFLSEAEAAPDASPAAALGDRLVAQIERLIETFDTRRGRQITLTMAAADGDSEIARAFRTRIILQYREEGRAMLLAAQQAGEVRRPDDIEALLDLLYAPVFYRLLVGHAPLTPALARSVVDVVLAGISR